jgi:tRNA(Ile)-lysidine synthase
VTSSSELRAALLARCAFPEPGAAVTCAVSGGADSLALLVLAVAAGCRVTAVHVDHGLRPGSASEADLVAAAAAQVGAGFRSLRVEVAAGPNLEARARAARFAALPPDVLTGHTADDQAETVLVNLCWGAALDGLAGMGRAGHPLLDLRRDETAALCVAEGLVPLQDPSNADPAFRRNRMRHEALPLLADIARRDVVPVIARQAELLRGDAELLDALAADIDPTDAAALAAPVADRDGDARGSSTRRCRGRARPRGGERRGASDGGHGRRADRAVGRAPLARRRVPSRRWLSMATQAM